MKYYVLSLLILFFNFAGWSCPSNVTKLNKGEAAPCTGYLFNLETELEARIAIQSSQKKDQIVKIQEEMLGIQNERVKNFQDENEALQKRLKVREDERYLSGAAGFLIGAILTGFIATNVGR
jgi:hypothetical protein